MATEISDATFSGDYEHEWQRILAKIRLYMMGITVCMVMASLGCLTKPQSIWQHIRKPIGICIGLSSQFVIMPLVGFGIAHMLQLEPLQAISLMVLSCTPGGAVSNIFTYLTHGDMDLSLTMTSASTILALGLMPLNLYIYTGAWTSESLKFPFKNVGISLVMIVIPVICGMLFAYKWPKLSSKVEKYVNRIGMCIIFVGFIIAMILDYKFIFTSWKVWTADYLLTSAATTLGYLLAWILRQKHKICRTIAFETGSQNVPLTINVLLMTFKGKAQSQVVPIPFIYGIAVVTTFICITIVIRYRKYRRDCRKANEEPKVEVVNETEIVISKETSI
ncbi:SLC10A6 (predicted) [Pycnogonum litorale]